MELELEFIMDDPTDSSALVVDFLGVSEELKDLLESLNFKEVKPLPKEESDANHKSEIVDT